MSKVLLTNENMLYIVIALLSVVLIIIIIIFTEEGRHYVHNSKCNRPVSEFSVEPGLTSTEILTSCNNSPCVFNNIPTLTEAITKCNVMSKICDRFIYNSATSTMSIIGLKSSLSNNTGSNIYTRQVGVTYKTII